MKREKLMFMMTNLAYLPQYIIFLDCNSNWVEKVFLIIPILLLYRQLLFLQQQERPCEMSLFYLDPILDYTLNHTVSAYLSKC